MVRFSTESELILIFLYISFRTILSGTDKYHFDSGGQMEEGTIM